MEDKDLKKMISSYSDRSLEQRKNWYSTAAEAYNKARPSYPKELIQQVVEIAQLSSNSKILEVGCGPGTAAVTFAQLGSSMVCLEPNPDFCQLAQQNCSKYANVEIQNKSFEEWIPDTDRFNAVLAATSFHWIPSNVGYPKAAKALQENGYLILLWNKELQPCYEVYEQLSKVYQVHAPFLDRYENRETQEKILQGLGQIVKDSDQFKNIVSGCFESKVTYSVDEYLTLLTTYSPYLQLAPQIKEGLFNGLRDKIENNFGGSLQLSYLSAFNIAQPCYNPLT
jgi:protein-L-isoaspartate O-methyltransferase